MDVCARPGLIHVDAALARLLTDVMAIKETEWVSLRDAVGRVLAADVVAPRDVPPADNSAMDGYAVAVADLARGPLPVGQRIPAGSAPSPLLPGQCARIFTGAEVPTGADAVIMQESIDLTPQGIVSKRDVAVGDNIRRRGHDIQAGQVVLTAGSRLGAIAVGLLASLGIPQVQVYRRLRVALFSTGDELIEPGEPLAPGQIYNSNRYTLAALLRGWHLQVEDLGVVEDSPAATDEALSRAIALQPDVILSSGGVSVGEEDHVAATIRRRGHIDFWKIAIKPGKPLCVGAVAGIPYFGLPGNPQGALATLLIMARPWLLLKAGRKDIKPVVWKLPSAFDRPRAAAREEYLPARMTSDGLKIHDNLSSGALLPVAWADGWVRQPIGGTIISGNLVDFLPFASLINDV